jgi:PDZ domain
MKMHGLAMAALPLLAIAGMSGPQKGSGSAQDATGPDAHSPKGKLTRVMDGDKDKDDRFDRDAWRKRLATADLEDRVRAFDELAALAGRSDDARKALEEWSKDGKDAQLAWTSRLLLREIDKNPWRSLRPGFRGRGGMGGMGGMDPSFDFDDFARRFDDLDSMFGDLRSQWGDMLRAMPAPSAGSSSSKSMSLQVGPDGVTCEVTENVGGKEEKHKYTASSVDELLQAHPELRDSLGGTGFQVYGLPRGSLQFFPRRGPSGRAPLVLRGDGQPLEVGGDDTAEPPTDKLGIQCRAVTKDRAGELGLDAGVGLSVEDVVPGTIASLLGLRNGDVVIEVNGVTIHGTDDVKKALHDRAANADVSVVVVGQGGQKRTLTWKPKPAGDTSDKAEAKSGSRNL